MNCMAVFSILKITLSRFVTSRLKPAMAMMDTARPAAVAVRAW